MTMIRYLAAASLALTTACSVQLGNAKAAGTDKEMVSAKDPQTLVKALQAKGFQAQLTTAGGEPAIKSGAGGTQFTIFFENCTDGKDCTTVTFFTGFTDLEATLDRVNEWNRSSRFAHAYIDKEDDPVLRMDVDLDHDGIPVANFNEYLDVWSSLAPKYANFLRTG
jgi:hypothetical protein